MIHAFWHDCPLRLTAVERRVAIPWAHALLLLIKAKAVRLRRDFGQLLRAVQAHALLHRFHRDRDDSGRIIASIDLDYVPVRDLFADILAEAAELKVSETVAATVAAVAALQPADPRKDFAGNVVVTEGATTPAVAQALGIDRSAAHRRLRAAESKALIVNLEKRPRAYRPSYYRTLPAAEAYGDFLPSAEQLKKAYADDEGGK